MKVAMYSEDGDFQLVLTPETEFEKDALEKIKTGDNVTLYRGAFYACQGGWNRHRDYSQNESLIMKIARPELKSESLVGPMEIIPPFPNSL